MKRLLLLAALFVSTSHAQDLSGLGTVLTSLAAELPALNATMSSTTDTNIGLKKEYDVYVADQKEKTAALEVAKANVIRTVKTPMEAEVIAVVNSYNARCNRSFNRETELAQYNACLTEKANVEAFRQAKADWWVKYASDWNTANVVPINKVIEKQNTRLIEIDGQIKHNFALFLKAQDRSIALREQIAKIEASFVAACTAKATAQTLKWCHSVNWDGASTRLVPMYKWKGTGGAAPN